MPRGKPFAKGNKLGKGRPPLPADLKGISVLSREQVKLTGSELLQMPIAELKRISKDPQESALRAALASVILKSHSWGDASRLDFVLSRVAGKVKDEVEHTHRVEMPTREQALEYLNADYAVLPAGPVKVEDLE